MIADALRVEVERYAHEVRMKNPLMQGAKRGELTREHVVRYLTNVHHLVCHTPLHLVRARDRARELGDERLAVHFETRFAEEVGHEKWAEQDIASLARVNAPVMTDGVIASSMRSLLRYIEEIIDRDPALYLSYILLAEYLIVLLGPEFLTELEANCNIPKSSMTVIAKHAELDQDHTEEALENIDDLVGNPRKLPAMREALLESILRFDRFTVDMATLPISRTAHVGHASAA